MSLKQTPLTCSGHTRPIVDIDFSQLNNDGEYLLISACKDGKPMLRNGRTGDWVGTFEGHKGAVWAATLTCCGKLAATGAADFSARLWNAESGEENHQFTHKHIVKAVHFSKDSSKLLTGGNEKLIRIFDVTNYDADPVELAGHSGNLKKVLFVDDDKKVISAGEDRTLRVWDLGNNSEVQKIDLQAIPESIELSPNEELLTIALSNSVIFLNTKTLEVVKEVEVPCKVYSASLHPEKAMFVCGGEDFKVYKYDYATSMEVESCKGHFGPIHSVRVSPDGELYASGSEDGTIRLWQTVIGKSYGLWKCGDINSGDENCLSGPIQAAC